MRRSRMAFSLQCVGHTLDGLFVSVSPAPMIPRHKDGARKNRNWLMVVRRLLSGISPTKKRSGVRQTTPDPHAVFTLWPDLVGRRKRGRSIRSHSNQDESRPAEIQHISGPHPLQCVVDGPPGPARAAGPIIMAADWIDKELPPHCRMRPFRNLGHLLPWLRRKGFFLTWLSVQIFS